MKHAEGNFKNKSGANICYQSWLPETEPKAVLLVVHGLAEHCGRYMNVVNHFVPLGYAVYGLDHIGHGKSEGMRVYVDRFADFIEPLKAYFDMIQGWHPGKPIFLVAHSMGGLIGSVYLLEHQEGLKGAVLSAPATKVSENISPTTLFLARLLSNVTPKFRLAALDATGVSKDPEVVSAYINDPLVYNGKTTARLANEMLVAIQRVTSEAEKICLPILLVQGSEDKLVDPGGAKVIYDQARSTDKTLKVYQGLYHEVFNEPERGQVLKDVEDWLEARL